MCVWLLAASPLFTERHSGKSYDETRLVTREQIECLTDAARWAPSSHNDQPWMYIVCDRSTHPQAYQKALSCLKDRQMVWASKAPLIVLVAFRTHLTRNGKFNPYAQYDTGASAISMALQASDLGFMAHQIGGFEKEKARALFALPDKYMPMTMMVIGYEAENPLPHERTRRPLEESFFFGGLHGN